MLPYTIWNWRLALSGTTNVEHKKNLFKKDKDDTIDYDEQKKKNENNIDDVMQMHDD